MPLAPRERAQASRVGPDALTITLIGYVASIVTSLAVTLTCLKYLW